MPQSRNRQSRVTFLRSPFMDGERLELPEKYRFSNIIEHNSLPISRESAAPPPRPDADVYDIPDDFWPPEDTDLAAEDTSADQLWEECRRNAANKSSSRCVRAEQRKKDSANKSNCASKEEGDDPDTDAEDQYKIDNEELDRTAMRLERLPELDREEELQLMRKEFSNEEFQMLQKVTDDRSRVYLQNSKQAYEDRGVGPIPASDNPNILSKELKRRVGCQEIGIDWSLKQAKPRRQRKPKSQTVKHIPESTHSK